MLKQKPTGLIFMAIENVKKKTLLFFRGLERWDDKVWLFRLLTSKKQLNMKQHDWKPILYFQMEIIIQWKQESSPSGEFHLLFQIPIQLQWTVLSNWLIIPVRPGMCSNIRPNDMLLLRVNTWCRIHRRFYTPHLQFNQTGFFWFCLTDSGFLLSFHLNHDHTIIVSWISFQEKMCFDPCGQKIKKGIPFLSVFPPAPWTVKPVWVVCCLKWNLPWSMKRNPALYLTQLVQALQLPKGIFIMTWMKPKTFCYSFHGKSGRFISGWLRSLTPKYYLTNTQANLHL